MEQSDVKTALTDNEVVPATQCPACGSRVLFWWSNPKGRSVTLFCPACRMVKTEAKSESNYGRSSSKGK